MLTIITSCHSKHLNRMSISIRKSLLTSIRTSEVENYSWKTILRWFINSYSVLSQFLMWFRTRISWFHWNACKNANFWIKKQAVGANREGVQSLGRFAKWIKCWNYLIERFRRLSIIRRRVFVLFRQALLSLSPLCKFFYNRHLSYLIAGLELRSYTHSWFFCDV